MRDIAVTRVIEAVSRLVREANTELPEDVLTALRRAREAEVSEAGQQVLDAILENARIAAAEKIPLCQDTGAAVVMMEIGQEVHISGGDLYAAVNEGVRRGYVDGFLRKSMVIRPYSARTNTGDNAPAIIHTDIVPGDGLKISIIPKGGGSENMTRLFMLPPHAGRQGVTDCIVRAVDEAGSNPCPPIIVGIGIGGTAETALLLSKKALLRLVGEPSTDPETAALEKEILESVNRLGIGPMGYGGRITALAVHAEVAAAHLASLPVGVNLQCHSLRRKEVRL
jgi:fumarate hydratase subunit alpha